MVGREGARGAAGTHHIILPHVDGGGGTLPSARLWASLPEVVGGQCVAEVGVGYWPGWVGNWLFGPCAGFTG